MAHTFPLLRAAWFAVCLLAGNGPATAASRRDTWQWNDILEPPLIGPDSAQCSPTHPVHKIPDFGDGLIASYSFDADDRVGDVASHISELNDNPQDHETDDYDSHSPDWALSFPEKIPHGAAYITVGSNFVLSSMDALLGEYARVCSWSHEPGLILRSITYRRASLRERAETARPRRERISVMPFLSAPFELVHVEPEPGATDILPEPVPGGDFRFSTLEEGATVKPGEVPLEPPFNWTFDASRIARGAGVHLALLSAGHTELDTFRHLVDEGFEVMTIEHDGMIETLVMDPTVLDSEAKIQERVLLLAHSWLWRDTGYSVRGMRLVFFSGEKGTIDALRVSQTGLLKDHIIAVQTQMVAEALTKEKQLPSERDIEKIISNQWSRFDGLTQGPGYDAVFGPPGTRFGRLYDLTCEPAPPGIDPPVFTCIAGVLFVDDGHPKYERRSLIFERFGKPDDDSFYRSLKRHDPPTPTPDAARVQSGTASARIADGPDVPPGIAEVEQLLKAGWVQIPRAILSGSPEQLSPDGGFSDEIAEKGDSFGEVKDLACTKRDQIFSCNIGVLFMHTNEPDYKQRAFTFNRVRRDDGVWELKYYIDVPDIIVTTRGDHPTPNSMRNRKA